MDDLLKFVAIIYIDKLQRLKQFNYLFFTSSLFAVFTFDTLFHIPDTCPSGFCTDNKIFS